MMKYGWAPKMDTPEDRYKARMHAAYLICGCPENMRLEAIEELANAPKRPLERLMAKEA
jgi:hypothetical protein